MNSVQLTEMILQRLKSFVFGKNTEKPSVILSQRKTPGTVEQWVTWLLAQGVQPKHVVLVLDSTREDFNRNISAGDVVEADLSIAWRVLSLARKLGAEEVTAQLLQQFPPRDHEDMQAIYRGLREALKTCLEFGGELEKSGVRVQAFGDLEKLPMEIQRLIAKVELRTAENEGLRTNVTFGDAARHGVSTTAVDITNALVNGNLHSEDVTHDFLDTLLDDSMPPIPDVYIKTSDVTSLYSALRQLLPVRVFTRSFVYNLFIKDYLPDLAFWTYAKAVLDFQKDYAILQQRRLRDRSFERRLVNIFSEQRRNEFYKLRTSSRDQVFNKLQAIERPLLSIEDGQKDEEMKLSEHNPHTKEKLQSPNVQKRFTLNFRLN